MTSFGVARRLTDSSEVVSIASTYPSWLNLSFEIPEFAPLRSDGTRFRIRDYPSVDAFLGGMTERLESVGHIGADYLAENPYVPVLLCCWCPGTRVAKVQLQEHGTFVCHREAVAKWLAKDGRFEVYYDRDAERMYRMS
jgi:hypothetical protein